MKNILITGSNGFIGKNLVSWLKNIPNISIKTFERDNDISLLSQCLKNVDYVIHLAGENRTNDLNNYYKNNVEFTLLLSQKIRQELEKSKRLIKLIFASSSQALLKNPYGRSKLKAEKILEKLSKESNCYVNIFRLPGIFGKWCKPNYNSVVATFCHRISKNIPIKIDDPNKKLKLVYIDDVINEIVKCISKKVDHKLFKSVKPEYTISLSELAIQIKKFKLHRKSLDIENFGSGLTKFLYATYLSYLSPENFSYKLKVNTDPRGKFVEAIKSKSIGQISFLTINPKQKRGGHYHNTKTEKFFVIQGEALFRFRHLLNNNYFELKVSANNLKVVDTVPGWSHDIINTGRKSLIIILWSNEIYDAKKPDTIQHKI